MVRRSIIPLGIILLVAAGIYSFLSPALLRAKARGAGTESLPFGSAIEKSLYWQLVERTLGDTYKQIFAINIDGSERLEDNDLRFLLRIPEVHDLRLSFHDLSDEFLATLVGEMDDLEVIDFSGTFAGEKTLEALLRHPSRGYLDLHATRITREQAERLQAAGHIVYWSQPPTPARREQLQRSYPGVVHSQDGDFDTAPSLRVFIDKLTPKQINAINQVSGDFQQVEFSSGTLKADLARTLLHGKEVSEISVHSQVTLTDPTWLADLPRLESLEFWDTTIDLPAVESGPCLPPKIGQMNVLQRFSLVGEGGIGRLLQGCHVETLEIAPYKLQPADLVGIENLHIDEFELDYPATDALLKLVTQNRNIQDLTLIRASKTGLLAVGKMTQLRHLELTESDLTEPGIDTLASLTNLTSLSLWDSDADYADIEQLLPLQKLEKLSISNDRTRNNLTAGCLPTLAKFPKLRTLYIGGTSINDVDQLLALPALESVGPVSQFSDADRGRMLKVRPSLTFEH